MTLSSWFVALIFLGKSSCALCGELLLEGQAIKGLPPISASEHPLYSYFDRGFHSQCFESWNQKDEALSLLKADRQAFINSAYYAEMVAKYGKPKWLDEQD